MKTKEIKVIKTKVLKHRKLQLKLFLLKMTSLHYEIDYYI
jgi:hypothetical protein